MISKRACRMARRSASSELICTTPQLPWCEIDQAYQPFVLTCLISGRNSRFAAAASEARRLQSYRKFSMKHSAISLQEASLHV
jgi:hypothetical protein